MTAWMFPGQGSQSEDMFAGLSEAERLLAGSARTLEVDLSRTTRAPVASWPPALIQPAIFAASVAAGLRARKASLSPGSVVGHSLGEYAALTIAGALDFEDALTLVAARGRAMAEAGRINGGGMAAVIGLTSDRVQEVCDDLEDVWVANLNSSHQTVISGKEQPLALAAQQLLTVGARRVMRLRVPMAAHCPLMAPARDTLRVLAAEISFRSPEMAFYSPVDAGAHTDPDEIRDLLLQQITSPVRFSDTINAMLAAGISNFVEIGPGKVLQGLVSSISADATVAGIASDDDADRVLGLSAAGASPG